MTKRYEVRPVKDADCTLTGDVIASFDAAEDAKAEAGAIAGGFVFGAAVVDSNTGLTDWGHGFGVPFPAD